ncbi:putative Ig domain-containing protein, partial [Alphaproteobacteria bacterium]|nr:putative Ig domain-containing protein [Alphaproteobacteria bacterium]
MSVKYVCIIVDDFTDKALAYPNVQLYDYGEESSVTYWDSYYYDYYQYPNIGPFGYGDVDSTFVNFSNSDYYHQSQFYAPTVTDAGTLDPILSDYNAYFDLYMLEGYNEYSTIDQLAPQFSSNDVMGHGDWVLESFFQQLDDPNAVEIVAIDIDFTNFQDFDRLFDGDEVFRACYVDAINRVYEPDNTYLLSVFNASFGGYSPPPNAVDNFINEQNAFVVQASANVGQSGDSWSSSIHNVINVGAWNTDLQGNSLASDINAIDFNDVYADGYVIDETWGNGFNFGTSFAAPRVSAEIINFYDTVLTPLILEDGLQSSGETLSNEEMTNITDFTVSAISTEMEIFVNELGQFVGPLNVLSDDILIGLDPVEVPIEINNFSFQVGEARNYAGDGLTILDLDDPLQLNEYIASSSDDTITGFSNAVFFGGAGDDTFKSDISAFNQIFVGGEGGDTYSINATGFMTIYDNGYSGTDVVETSGIGLSSETSYVATIEGRHLLGYDTYSQQSILVIDYQSPENRIEQIKFSDGSYTYDEVINHISLSDNFLGDLSWSAASSTFTSSEINAGLQYYKDWYNQSSNNAPYITSSPTTEINEKVGYSYIIIALDDDPESSLSINVSGLPSWLNFNSTTREIYGTPEQTHVGNYTFEVEVLDDKGASVTQSITLTVNNVNDAPVFDFAPPNSTDEDAAFEYQLTATDIDMDVVDNETLTFEAVTTPDWMSVSSSGLITGTPENDDVGEHAITVKVTDSAGESDRKTFTLTVNNTNDLPNLLFRYGDQPLEEGLNFNLVDEIGYLGNGPTSAQLDISISDDGQKINYISSYNENGSYSSGAAVSDIDGNLLFEDFHRSVNTTISPDGKKIAYQGWVYDEGRNIFNEFAIFVADIATGEILEISSLFDRDIYAGSSANRFSAPIHFSADSNFVSFNLLSDEASAASNGASPWDQAFYNIANNSVSFDAPEDIAFVNDCRASLDGRYKLHLRFMGDEFVNKNGISATELAREKNTFDLTNGSKSKTATFLILEDKDKQEQFIVDSFDGGFSNPSVTELQFGSSNYAKSSQYDVAMSSNGKHIVIKKGSGEDARLFHIDNPIFQPPEQELENSILGENGGFFDFTDPDPNQILELKINDDFVAQQGSSIIQGEFGRLDIDFESKTFKYTVDTEKDAFAELSLGAQDLEKFSFVINDGFETVQSDLKFIVVGSNDPPEFNFTPPSSLDEDVAFSLSLIADDPDSFHETVNFTYTSIVLPTWLTLTSDGVLQGAPKNEHVGDHEVSVRVTDQYGASSEKNFTLTVNNVNDPPTLEEIPDASVNEDAAFNYQLTAADVDVGDVLSFVGVHLPSWLSLSETGMLSGMPDDPDIGTHLIVVQVEDESGEAVQKQFNLTINNVNDPPEFNFTPPSSLDEDVAFSLSLIADDPDSFHETVNFTYTSIVLPTWLTLTSDGVLQGAPKNEHVGDHEVSVRVTDQYGASSEKNFTLTVNNTNDAPTINVGDANGALADGIDGSAFSHQLGVSDVDEGDTHSYSMSSAEDISWLSLDAATGLLTGSPDDEHVGVYNITFSVEDAAGVVSTSDTISLTINNVNDPVYLDQGQFGSFKADKEGIYQIAISDEDLADSYNFTSDNLPDWLSLDPATGVLTGTPTRADDGIYEINVTVTDEGGLSDSGIINIKSTSYQYATLGSGSDVFIGENVQDHVSTGGGDDVIDSGAGDDVVVVQGEGDVAVDTGVGDDRVIVEGGWSGTLLLKNGAGFNVLELLGDYENIEAVSEDGGTTITNGESDNVIQIEGQHFLNEDTGLVEIADTGFQFIKFYGHSSDGVIQDYATYVVVGNDDANYLIANQPDDAEEQDEVFVFSGAGSDVIEVNAANGIVEGGLGDDVIYINAVAGDKMVFGDIFLGDDGGVRSTNTNYADKVYIDWVYDSESIAEISGTNGQGVVVWNDDLGARVEIYDAEELIFRTEEGGWDAGISIGETAVVGTGTDPDDPLSWKNGHHGKSFSYSDDNIRFVLTDKPAADGGGDAPSASPNGDATSDWLQVYATATTTETYTYYQHKNGKTRSSPAKGYAKKTGTRETEEEA